MTKEHLPFKALYKGIDQAQNRAAVIKICFECNQKKSIWDQEFLSVYGHLLDIQRAQKAQNSLKTINDVSDAMTFALVASRITTKTGDTLAKFNGVPTNLISQWFNLCGRGIYYYFKRKAFRGVGLSIIPEVIDHNMKASTYKADSGRDGFTEDICHISECCSISISQQEGQSPFVKTSIINKKNDRMFSIAGFFIEEESQLTNMRSSRPNGQSLLKPIRFAQPRDIHDVNFKESGGYDYRGVKKS